MSAEQHARDYVRAELVRRGWSQHRLARELVEAGVPLTQVAVSRWVNPGKHHPRVMSVDEAVAVAQAFDVPLLDLLGLGGKGVDRELARRRRAVARAHAVLSEVLGEQ